MIEQHNGAGEAVVHWSATTEFEIDLRDWLAGRSSTAPLGDDVRAQA